MRIFGDFENICISKMSHILDEPFFDITNDLLIGSNTDGEYMTVFKNSYPDLLFLGPFNDDNKNLIIHLYTDLIRKIYNLKGLEPLQVYIFTSCCGNSRNLHLNKELSNTPVISIAYPNFLKPRLGLLRTGMKLESKQINMTASGNFRKSTLNFPDFINEKLSKLTKEKMSQLKVNAFTFHEGCVTTTKYDIDTTLYDHLKGCVYNQLKTDEDRANFKISTGSRIGTDLLTTFVAMYLVGFEFDLSSVNNETQKIDFTRYSDYLVSDPNDAAPFMIDSDDEVGNIIDEIIRSKYPEILQILLNMNLRTGTSAIDEILQYRAGVLIGLLEKYSDSNNIKDITPPSNEGYFTIEVLDKFYFEPYFIGNALVKNNNFMEVPRIDFTAEIFNRTKDGYIYDYNDILQSRTLNDQTVEYMLKTLKRSILANNVPSAIQTTMEIYRYALADRYDVVELLYDKLLDISIKYVLPTNLGFHAYMINWVENWVKQGKDEYSLFQGDSDFDIIDKRYNPYRLILVLWVLCNFPKSEVILKMESYDKAFEGTRDEIDGCKDFSSMPEQSSFSLWGLYQKKTNLLLCLLEKYLDQKKSRAIMVGIEMLKDDQQKINLLKTLESRIDPGIYNLLKMYQDKMSDDRIYYLMLLNLIKGSKENLDLLSYQNYINSLLTQQIIDVMVPLVLGKIEFNLETIQTNKTIQPTDAVNLDPVVAEIITE